jgi:RNA polymerase sigma-32 factor
MQLPTREQTARPSTDRDPELALIRAYQRGDKRAGDQLVRAHLAVIRAIAHGYRLWGVGVDDLIQQGCLGFLKAVERFDAERAPSLQAYATYWIRAEIRDYVVRGYRIVRLGTTRTERKALRMYRVREIADAAQLAEQSGMPLARCEQLWPLLTQRDSHIDDTRKHPAPLDRMVQETQTPESLALMRERAAMLRARVGDAMSGLSPRERRILEARMMTDEPSTLEALGVELGLSRERVRQLEAVAKAKVKDRLSLGAAA